MKLLNDKNDVRLRVRWGAGILLFLVVGSFIYSKVFTPMSEERAQTLLEKEFVPALLNGIAPVGYPIESGTSVALLEVKDIDLRRVVIEGTKAEELAKGPGHLVGSAIPGQPGTSAILATPNPNRFAAGKSIIPIKPVVVVFSRTAPVGVTP